MMTDRELLTARWMEQNGSTAVAEARKYDAELARQIHGIVVLLDDAYHREVRTRKRLLRLHSWRGIGVGISMLFTGVPAVFEQQLGLWTRPFLGSIAVVAGLLLSIGLKRRHEATTLEVLGLVAIGFWDACVVASLLSVYGLFHGPWQAYLPWHLHPISDDQPRLYALFVYASLALMVWTVHLPAVLRERRRAD